MSDVTVQTTDATPKEEVVDAVVPSEESEAEVDKEIPRFGDDWKPVEGVRTGPDDWSKDDQKWFGLADFGDKTLMDEDGVGEWGNDLVNCVLKVDPKVTSAADFAKMVRADALSGKMTVEDIFNKYCHGTYK